MSKRLLSILAVSVPIVISAQTERPIRLSHDIAFGRELDPQQVTAIGWTVIASSGLTYIADGFRILVVDKTGRITRQFGRQGRGPGEFLRGIGPVKLRGDTIWIYDGELRRITSFAPPGFEPHNVTPPKIDPNQVAAGLTFYRVLPDGSFLFQEDRMEPGVGSADIPGYRFRIVHVSPEGTVLNPVIDTIHHPVVVISSSNITTLPIDFDPEFVECPDGDHLYLVEREPRQIQRRWTFSVRRFDVNGHILWARNIPFVPEKVPSNWMDSSTVRYRKDPMTRKEVIGQLHRARALIREVVGDPKFFPVSRSILAGSDGTLFISRGAPSQETRWLVISNDGKALGTFVLPRGASLLGGNRTHVWVRALDTNEEGYVVDRYRLDVS